MIIKVKFPQLQMSLFKIPKIWKNSARLTFRKNKDNLLEIVKIQLKIAKSNKEGLIYSRISRDRLRKSIPNQTSRKKQTP